MRAPDEIRADLESRDLLSLALRVAKHHHVQLEEILEPNRTTDISSARQHLYFELAEVGVSHRRIAILFGVDRTSVIYGVRRWRQYGLKTLLEAVQ